MQGRRCAQQKAKLRLWSTKGFFFPLEVGRCDCIVEPLLKCLCLIQGQLADDKCSITCAYRYFICCRVSNGGGINVEDDKGD